IKDLMAPVLASVDDRVLEWLGVCFELTSEEAWYLESGDRLELWLWAWEEVQRGNRRFMDWVRHYIPHFRDHPPPPSFGSIMEAVLRDSGLPPLSHQQLMEAAGL
ncbi:MAG: hypothetical protein KGR26_15340, partial [Cyanobacteria bacterium REEB65]|nr:hypothetical protein [Cyanobacteria bacterium REEB65]